MFSVHRIIKAFVYFASQPGDRVKNLLFYVEGWDVLHPPGVNGHGGMLMRNSVQVGSHRVEIRLRLVSHTRFLMGGVSEKRVKSDWKS